MYVAARLLAQFMMNTNRYSCYYYSNYIRSINYKNYEKNLGNLIDKVRFLYNHTYDHFTPVR